MRLIILCIICLQSVSMMGQLTMKDLVGSYDHNEIASGEQAKVDHANYYSTIDLKKDGTFLWTEQQGRLSAEFRYRYGTWDVQEQEVILILKADAFDYQQYPKSSKGYGNNPYSKALKRKETSSVYYLIADMTGDRVVGLREVDTVYKRN